MTDTRITRRSPQSVEAQAAPAAMSPVYLGSIAVPAHEVLDLGRKIAVALADIIEQQKLYTNIQGKKHVRVEGWTTLGAMLGVVPLELESKDLGDGSYESTVELVRTSDGQPVGRASAVCGTEGTWKGRDKYARKSMATTRATGKAFRLGFSWIMVLCGYEPTPSEEMPHGWGDSGSKEAQQAVATEKLAEMRRGDPTLAAAIEPQADIREDPLPQATPEPEKTTTGQQSTPSPTPQGRVIPKISTERMAQFAKAKAAIGPDAYYRILQSNGYGKSNQIPTEAEAKRCLKEMGKLAKALELERANRESNEASLICARVRSGCPIHISNQIATCIKALKVPLERANMDLQCTLTDRRAMFPDMSLADHWQVILCGLQDVVKNQHEKGTAHE